MEKVIEKSDNKFLSMKKCVSTLQKSIELYKSIYKTLLVAPADLFLNHNIKNLECDHLLEETSKYIRSEKMLDINHILYSHSTTNTTAEVLLTCHDNKFVQLWSLHNQIMEDVELVSHFNTSDLKALQQFNFSKKNYESEALSSFFLQYLPDSTELVIEVGCGKSYMTNRLLESRSSLKYLGIDREFLDKKMGKKDNPRIMLLKQEVSSKQHSFVVNEAKIFSNSNLDIKSKNDFALIGLHSCGDLTSEAIKLFTKSEDIKSLGVVGCCLHLLTEQISSSARNSYLFKNYYDSLGNSTKGRFLDETIILEIDKKNETDDKTTFPLSATLKDEFEKNGLFFGRTIRKLSMLNYPDEEKEFTINTIFFKKAFIRAIYQRFLEIYIPSLSSWYGYGEIEIEFSSKKKEFDLELIFKDFMVWIAKAFIRVKSLGSKILEIDKLSQVSLVFEDMLNNQSAVIHDFVIEQSKYLELLTAFFLVRFKFSRIIEYIVAMDRILYLFEECSQLEVRLFQIFDYHKSKRNLLIFAQNPKLC